MQFLGTVAELLKWEPNQLKLYDFYNFILFIFLFVAIQLKSFILLNQ